MRLILTLLVLSAAVALSWVENKELQEHTVGKTPTSLPKVTVNLDLEPKDRWVDIAANFKQFAPAIMAYLESVIPKWAIPIVETIAADIRPYFGDEYGNEMVGLAQGLGLKVGDVVAMNLIYQLESIGLNCSNWNNTGPTIPNDPGCIAVDPKQQWCYCKKHADQIDTNGLLFPPAAQQQNGPGLCTSVVAQDNEGVVYHGRNLDWNLPSVIRKLAVDATFTRNNKTVFIGTTMVGFVGVINGMRRSADGSSSTYSVSIDARGKGGKILDNLAEALLHHGATPTQHLRSVFTSQEAFDGAVTALSTGALIDEIYYISAGAKAGQGVVISRDRNDGVKSGEKADQWFLNLTDPSGWYRLQTNYDHWQPVPKADDRRTPGYAAMNKMTRQGLTNDNLFAVMKTWPVFNHHTDYTGMIIPAIGQYNSIIWMD